MFILINTAKLCFSFAIWKLSNPKQHFLLDPVRELFCGV